VAQIRDGAALPAILTRMAVRRAGMALRSRRVRALVTLTPSAQLPEVAVVPPDLDVRRALAVLYRLLDRVKPRQRMAFVLRDILGMDLAEVAAALELSDTAARRALTEGRKRVLRLARHEPHLGPFLAAGSRHSDGGAT
jgi:RNA polymerase sigma-70 factor, ECF subfamily